ncbi:unnamed protein product [Parnassius apollo]|uniref:Elongation of very long chain fatty acids protein n=1 Tax=Parnassius apollo TaxID=110799 RepID=A0A8S3WYB3_PARAO|nr:unnamed protein product [Parnassius apollo]
MDLKLVTTNRTFPEHGFWDFKGKVDYVDGWFLMKSPVPLLFLSISYLLFVLKLGPKVMKLREPFKLRSTIILYNLFQVAYSCFLLFKGSRLIIPNGLLGSSCLMDEEDFRWRVSTGIYYYFFAKVTELMDTIFFVLRKNFRQVTFLHVYHHSLMMWSTWIALKYEPSYNVIFLGTINSSIHIIMYGYYALSAFPDLNKYLWWKKYITLMQILQFMCIILHAAANYAYSACPPSYTLLASILLNALLFVYLFAEFYVNSYVNKNKINTRSKSINSLANGSVNEKSN